jgi:hypothetical protein
MDQLTLEQEVSARNTKENYPLVNPISKRGEPSPRVPTPTRLDACNKVLPSLNPRSSQPAV